MFFKGFDDTINLILCRTAILKNICFCRTPSSMVASFHSLNTNDYYILFTTAWQVPKYGVFSGPYFPAFVLNTERYFVSLCIQSECGKIRTRKKPVFGHISYSVLLMKLLHAIAKILLKNKDRTKTYGSIFFCKDMILQE